MFVGERWFCFVLEVLGVVSVSMSMLRVRGFVRIGRWRRKPALVGRWSSGCQVRWQHGKL